MGPLQFPDVNKNNYGLRCLGAWHQARKQAMGYQMKGPPAERFYADLSPAISDIACRALFTVFVGAPLSLRTGLRHARTQTRVLVPRKVPGLRQAEAVFLPSRSQQTLL